MTGFEALLVVLAGVGAGTVNAVVGSGSLITFPTLLAVGYSPVVANVSNNIGVVPGSILGAYGFRRELAGQGTRVRTLAVASALGGLTGGGCDGGPFPDTARAEDPRPGALVRGSIPPGLSQVLVPGSLGRRRTVRSGAGRAPDVEEDIGGRTGAVHGPHRGLDDASHALLRHPVAPRLERRVIGQ